MNQARCWSGLMLTGAETNGRANQRPLVLCSWSIVGSKRGVWFSRWCRSARTRMSPTRPRCRKRTAGRRWIIAGINFASSGTYLETRAEDVAEHTIQAVEKMPDTIDSINNEAKCTRRTKEKLLGARKALESFDSEGRSCGG